jgi:hypothetical protein
MSRLRADWRFTSREISSEGAIKDVWKTARSRVSLSGELV